MLDSASNIPDEIQELILQRNKAKETKDFELADKLRSEVLSRGYKIIDDKS